MHQWLKKSPKDNKCPKSQEIRRRKNSQVNITQGARKYTKYTKVYHMTKAEWGKIHRSKTKLNHQKEVREREREVAGLTKHLLGFQQRKITRNEICLKSVSCLLLLTTKKISKLAKKSRYGNCDRPRKRKEQCAKNQKCFH